jgi:hypothetical protein
MEIIRSISTYLGLLIDLILSTNLGVLADSNEKEKKNINLFSKVFILEDVKLRQIAWLKQEKSRKRSKRSRSSSVQGRKVAAEGREAARGHKEAARNCAIAN